MICAGAATISNIVAALHERTDKKVVKSARLKSASFAVRGFESHSVQLK